MKSCIRIFKMDESSLAGVASQVTIPAGNAFDAGARFTRRAIRFNSSFY
jgi:hypothetical protein